MMCRVLATWQTFYFKWKRRLPKKVSDIISTFPFLFSFFGLLFTFENEVTRALKYLFLPSNRKYIHMNGTKYQNHPNIEQYVIPLN